MIKLFSHIFRNGKFRHSGFDFAEQRHRTLAEFPGICPPHSKIHQRTARLRHPVFKMLVAEAAFVKACLRFRGNHLSIPEQSISYIRIPRSGSTALCKAILLNKYPELMDRSLSPQQVNQLADLHMHHTLPDKEVTFFTVVRNPFARIVSVYREFFEKERKPFLYDDYLFGALRQQMSFTQFVSTVRLIPDLLKDQHLKPQQCFLRYYERNGKPVRVLKLEDDVEIRNFLAAYGLMFENFNHSEEPYDYSSYYDRGALADVLHIYKVDILRFGYEPAYDELRACL